MKYEFQVETVFNQVHVVTDDKGNQSLATKLARNIMSFQDEKKHIAKFEANKYMDKTIRHGLSMHGGSILEFIVHPSAILTVSIQDMQLATEEEELGKEETTEAV